jgi:hypothetical protein
LKIEKSNEHARNAFKSSFFSYNVFDFRAKIIANINATNRFEKNKTLNNDFRFDSFY